MDSHLHGNDILLSNPGRLQSLVLTTCRTTYYNVIMLKTYLYIPDHLETKIVHTAKIQRKSKAEIIRQALEKGITVVQHQGTASARALLKLAEVGQQYTLKGPKDSSERMDELLWGKEWDKK